MNPSYHFNPPSVFVTDELNLNNQPLPSISSSSSSSRNFFGSDQDPDGPYSPRELLSTQQRSEDDDLTPEWNTTHINSFQNKEDRSEDLDDRDDYYSSDKWLPSKLRIIRKMMSSNKAGGNPVATNSDHKFEYQKRLSSPPAVELNTISKGSSYRNNDSTVRVCSDCNTTKTPLWRSGPRGPKSLCNACGIRQRKARRALAVAAAAANGTNLPPAATTSIKFKVKSKTKRPRNEGNNSRPMKKGWKHSKLPSTTSPIKKINNFWYEDFTSSILSKHYSMHQRVFPQDEREAAILLMSLSYGLVRG